MKRDLDLIKKILLAIEAAAGHVGKPPAIDGYSDKQVGFHSWLLVKAGFVAGAERYGDCASADKIEGLTMAGYDYLSQLKSGG